MNRLSGHSIVYFRQKYNFILSFFVDFTFVPLQEGAAYKASDRISTQKTPSETACSFPFRANTMIFSALRHPSDVEKIKTRPDGLRQLIFYERYARKTTKLPKAPCSDSTAEANDAEIYQALKEPDKI